MVLVRALRARGNPRAAFLPVQLCKVRRACQAALKPRELAKWFPRFFGSVSLPGGLPSGPPSSRGILSPPPLTCFQQVVHVPRWTNLENAAVLQCRMLRHELHGMIHVPRLKDENAAELFLGFRIGSVRGCDLAVLPIQGQGGFRRLKRFSTSPMPVGAKMVVVFKAFVEHHALLALGHGFVFSFVVVSQTD